MATIKFPSLESGLVSFWYNGYLYDGNVEVRRSEVVVSIYNGYSIMFATFHFRKSYLMADALFLSKLDSLKSDFDDPALRELPLLRFLCFMAVRRLSHRSQRILQDSYFCAADIRAKVLNMLSR